MLGVILSQYFSHFYFGMNFFENMTLRNSNKYNRNILHIIWGGLQILA